MSNSVTVRPGDDEITASQVALWDRDPIHEPLSEAWVTFGGAYIVGDPANPDAIYTVAETPAVIDAIQKGRIIRVDPRLVKAIKADPTPTPDGDGNTPPADKKAKA